MAQSTRTLIPNLVTSAAIVAENGALDMATRLEYTLYC